MNDEKAKFQLVYTVDNDGIYMHADGPAACRARNMWIKYDRRAKTYRLCETDGKSVFRYPQTHRCHVDAIDQMIDEIIENGGHGSVDIERNGGGM